MSMQEHRKGLIWLVLYVMVVAVVMWFCKRNELPPGDDTLRINTVHPFERLASPSCNELASTSLMLLVEGMDTGLRSAGCQDSEKETSKAVFNFKHTAPANAADEAKSDTVWSVILGHPLKTLRSPRTLHYQIQRTDGTGDNLAPADAKVLLVIFEWWAPGGVALVVLVWGAMIYLGARTALVRDSGAPGVPLAQRTFSLARVQMAWWFAIVFASFVFLWLVTGETPGISAQALTLLGISSATTAASVGIGGPGATSDGLKGVFFRDLLSDADGVTIHRFQMLVMTIALGLVFLFHVASQLTMPEFDPSLLTLMGISAATYVGLKIPEKKADADAAQIADTVAEAKVGYSPMPE
ncbi:hypothetical protein [Ideonella sp.]|uniref:hypothetical protein n=1 Tax=Ideonella sp. TaxID=1929293 RepID=UPI0035B0C3FE